MNEKNELTLASGWSYCNEQILEFMPHLKVDEEISVLEFGCGDSTIKIFDYLNNKFSKVSYTCFETNENYGISHEKIELVYYSKVKKAVLPEKIFNLILIDGPTGKSRMHWYSKIKSNVAKGTIVHIDDFDHFRQFEKQLNKHHTYKELFRKERSKKGEKSWLTVEIA